MMNLQIKNGVLVNVYNEPATSHQILFELFKDADPANPLKVNSYDLEIRISGPFAKAIAQHLGIPAI